MHSDRLVVPRMEMLFRVGFRVFSRLSQLSSLLLWSILGRLRLRLVVLMRVFLALSVVLLSSSPPPSSPSSISSSISLVPSSEETSVSAFVSTFLGSSTASLSLSSQTSAPSSMSPLSLNRLKFIELVVDLSPFLLSDTMVALLSVSGFPLSVGLDLSLLALGELGSLLLSSRFNCFSSWFNRFSIRFNSFFDSLGGSLSQLVGV